MADKTPRPTVPLKRMFDLQEAGGVPHRADLRGLGRRDLLMLQAPGMYWNWEHMPINPTGARKPGHDHFCLTAFADTERGERLWQIGSPWRGDMPYWSHSAERTLTFADLDGDGRRELLVLRRQAILVVDPADGRILHEHPLPEENIEILCAGHTGPGPRDWTVFAGVSNQGRGGAMGNPGFFLDADLRVLETRDFYGAGHAPQALDLDGDGCDEFLIGYEWIDHDLTPRWVFRAFEDQAYDAGEMHVDAMDHAAFDAEGPAMIAYAASERQYVVDGHGRGVWMADRTHPQQCLFGRFRRDRPQQRQLFVLNKRAELDLFDPTGRLIWSFLPEPSWPFGKPAPFAQGLQFHLFDPAHLVRGAGPEGTDLILYLETGWPYLIDGDGRRCADLEIAPQARQDYPWEAGRPDDQGYGYLAVVEQHDDTSVLLLADRRHAFEYVLRRGS